jgi:membrane protein
LGREDIFGEVRNDDMARELSRGSAAGVGNSLAPLWREILLTPWRVYRNFSHDNGFSWAAAIAYYILLSVFPLVLLAVSLAAYIVDPKWAIEQASQLLQNFIPAQNLQIKDVVDGAVQLRARATAISLLFLLFTNSQVFGIVTQALNVTYDVGSDYGLVKRTLMRLGQAIVFGTLFIAGLGARFLLDLLGNKLQIFPLEVAVVGALIRVVLPVVLLYLAFFLTYRYVPRRDVSHRAALAGAAAALLMFVAARPVFLRYLQHFGDYNMLYGSLAVLIILVLWAWLVAIILLLGGHVTAHVQKVLIERQDANAIERRHELRSPNSGPDPAQTMVPEVKQEEGS